MPLVRIPLYIPFKRSQDLFHGTANVGLVTQMQLAKAGVPVEQVKAQGHFHSSFVMVDVVITGVPGRVKMAEALRGFAGLPAQMDAGRRAPPPEVNAAAN